MFSKILIANRGEIALRIMRACQELDIETVAVYSEADKDALHVRLADESVCIGPPPSSESYLNMPRIITAAELTNAEAIHPGYGFLAENPDFAEVCESCGIKFIGPSSEMIRQMGDKALARKLMADAGVPVIPGSEGEVSSLDEAAELAKNLGYPVMIKAVNGGGGKGMRVARDEISLRTGIPTAQAEAEAAFNSRAIYLEKLIEDPRHIEFQILGDSRGNLIHLFERDCSLQRRHQKLLEECPSTFLTPELRKTMGEAAVTGARNIGYESAGTIEFLVDSNSHFYFMEMNTRIQVEHPVTEQVIGIDLLKEQLRIAAGDTISLGQEDIQIRGHSIECRINAESPERSFMPSPGRIAFFHPPGGPGIRVDTHIYSGCQVPPYYDSMIAKIIATGKDRDESIRRMRRALHECVVEGVETTIPFHLRILSNEKFISGSVTTAFVEDLMKETEEVKTA
ncbi:MAG: acetyl-CoA carboxylase biotin carboxylase subunit [Candidatus Eisenbacteria bacterium]|nr:acetyl-CoA carboxylase biotin carboxylase subunit [Candidatus Eisenbacteria bacterium]